MLMNVWRWMTKTDDLGYIADWNSQRVQQYERETLRSLGRIEPIYTWSWKYRCQHSLANDVKPAMRRARIHTVPSTHDQHESNIGSVPANAATAGRGRRSGGHS